MNYRALNGSADDVIRPGSIMFNLSSADNGLLEVSFPRNFPYHNDIQSTAAANFLLLDEDDGEIAGTSVTATDCFFVFSVPFNNDAEVRISWTYLLNGAPVQGDDIPASCISQTVVEDVRVKGDGTIRPLDQVKAGIDPESVLCPTGLEVIVNPKGKPYCATEEIMAFLNRVWYR
jgi:hypothetical protein